MLVWINNPFDHLPGEHRRELRYSLLSRALAEEGHSVVFWSSDFNHALKRKRVLEPVYMVQERFQVRLIPTIPYYSNICLKRVISHRAYAAAWQRMALQAVESGELQKPDLILTSLPPISTASVARFLRKKWDCKIVIDIMDAWPETFFRLLPIPKGWRYELGPFFFFWNVLEVRRAYRQADAITAVGRTYLQLARNHGVRVPMHVCYHGILRLANGAFRYSLGDSEPLRLLYVGSMGRSYDLDTVIEGVMELRSEGYNVRLDLAGGGPNEKRLRSKAGKCPAILFHGYLSEEDLGQLLSDSDLAVVPMFQDSYVAVPYKLADYTSAGLPIIYSLGGETRSIIDLYQAGTPYEAGNVKSFKAAYLHYIQQPHLIQQESVASIRIAKERFMKEAIYPEFVQFLQETVTPKTR